MAGSGRALRRTQKGTSGHKIGRGLVHKREEGMGILMVDSMAAEGLQRWLVMRKNGRWHLEHGAAADGDGRSSKMR